MLDEMASPESEQPKGPERKPEQSTASSDEGDLLSWYLTKVDTVATEARGDIDLVDRGFQELNTQLDRRKELNAEQENMRRLIKRSVTPLVRYQEVESKRLEHRFEEEKEFGNIGVVRQRRDLFSGGASRPKEAWRSFKVADSEVGNWQIVKISGALNNLLNESSDTTATARRLKALWRVSETSRALREESEGIKRLRTRLKELERETAPSGINLDKPDFQLEATLKQRVDQGLTNYVRTFISSRERENSAESFPESSEQTIFLETVRLTGGERLVKEYWARKGLHKTDKLVAEKFVDDLEGLVRGIRWPDAVADMGLILEEVPGVGEAVQLAEIQAQGRKLEFLKERKEEIERFLSDPASTRQFPEIDPELREMAEIALNGGKVGEMEVRGINDEIKYLDGKENDYQAAEEKAKTALEKTGAEDRETASLLAGRIRGITGLSVEGNYPLSDKKRRDRNARGSRVLAGPMHFGSFIEAATGTQPERFSLVKYTPFYDLRLRSMWRARMGDFFEEKGMEDSEAIDLGLVNLADLDLDKFREKGEEQTLLAWLRDARKAYDIRGTLAILINRPTIGPENLQDRTIAVAKEAVGRFDYLRAAEQVAYQQWWLELATPNILQSLERARIQGGDLVPSIRTWLEQGAMAITMSRYFAPCEIPAEMSRLDIRQLTPEEKARFLIHTLYRAGEPVYKRYGRRGETAVRLKIEDGQTLARFLKRRFKGQASGEQLLKSMMAFAGVKLENGSLKIDRAEREKISDSSKDAWRRFFSSPAMRIIEYTDVLKLIDTAIWDTVGVDRRADLLRCFDEFYAYKKALRFGLGNVGQKGVRICSNEGDKLMEFFIGDGTDRLIREASRRSSVDPYFDFDRLVQILRMRMRFGREWQARIQRSDPWEYEMTPEDVVAFIDELCNQFDITGNQRRRLEKQAGYSKLRRVLFYVKRRWFFGVKDEKQEIAGAKMEAQMKRAMGGTVFGRIAEWLPFPKSGVDVLSTWAAISFFNGALGGSLGAWPLGIIAGSGFYNVSISGALRWLVKRPWVPGFFRAWDFKWDTKSVVRAVIEDSAKYAKG